MNRSAHALRPFRLIGFGIAVILTLAALLPATPAEAASCGGWGYFGCCFIGSQVKLRQQRTCCDDFGNCWNETRCTSSACPV